MKISFNNQTGFPSAEVYWTIIGMNQAGRYAHITADGSGNASFVPMSVNDNTNDGFADYSVPLSQCPSVSWPNNLFINSARIYISVGGYVPIKVQNNGYAPPSISNTGLAGYNLLYDFCEFAFMPAGGNAYNQLNFNTSSVDFFCIPSVAELSGGNLQQTLRVGYQGSRTNIFNAFSSCRDANFAGLIVPAQSNPYTSNLRAVSPANVFSGIVSASVLQYFTGFFDAYIQALWRQYKTQALTLKIGSDVYTGQVDGSNNFNFKDNSDSVVCTIPGLGSSNPVAPAISSLDVLGCRNSMAFGNATQKNIQKYIAAAINRTVMDTLPDNSMSDSWCDLAAKYYTNANAPVHYYALMLHQESLTLNGVEACYAFSYDDVCEQSSSIVGQDTDGSLSLNLILPAW